MSASVADIVLESAVRRVQESRVLESQTLMAVVSAVGTDGTVDVARGDSIFPRVRVLSGYPAPTVGDTVEILRTAGGWVCAGALVTWNTTWQYPTLNAGFVQHNAGFAPARYRRTATSIEIQGAVDPSAAGGQSLFTLAEGFRPSYNHTLATWQSDGAAQMRVYTTGEVRVYPTADTDWITLDCLVGI